MGTRQVPFSRELYIEQDDFREVPPKKYFRLAPGREVRLRYAYLVTCTERGQGPANGRGGRGALHLRSGHPRRQHARRPQGQGHDPLGSAAHALRAEVRLYDHLFTKPDPDEVPAGQDYKANLNPNSLQRLSPLATQ